MLNRRKIRELAMQVLFLWDTQGQQVVEETAHYLEQATTEPDLRQLALDMASGAWAQREPIDGWLERVAPQWPPRRQPAVDRALLRMAVWELTQSTTPHKVVIDEAIELAKEYSTENSSSFVNGVLDAIMKEHKRNTEEASQ